MSAKTSITAARGGGIGTDLMDAMLHQISAHWGRAIAAAGDVHVMKLLYNYNGKAGYSLGQGK